MINDINNGDSASDIRAKFNELIKIVNDYSSSQYMDYGGGGDPAPSGDFFTVWDNDYMTTTGVASSMDACSAIGMSASHDMYITKDPMNMAGTSVPESGDTLYTDSGLMMYAPEGMYFGWEDTAMMQNYSIYVGPNGMITSIDAC
jgi:hypothetical protein